MDIDSCMDDRYYMNLALEQARQAALMDEVPVGAVITASRGNVIGSNIINSNLAGSNIINSNVVGYGHNQPITLCDPTGHAEIVAIRMAAKATGNYRLTGTTLYVTIEPCIMCMGAIIHARIARVVYGAPDPKWGGAGSLYDFASDSRLNHNLEVVSGVCLGETREIIKSFFNNKRSK